MLRPDASAPVVVKNVVLLWKSKTAWTKCPDKLSRNSLAKRVRRGKWGCTKYRRIPKREETSTGRVPKRSLPRKNLQNKGSRASQVVHRTLRYAPVPFTPVLPCGQKKCSCIVVFFLCHTFGRRSEPKGPSRTKNTTDGKFTICSEFTTAIVIHYCGHFETTIFKGKLSSISLQRVKNYSSSKTLRNWAP